MILNVFNNDVICFCNSGVLKYMEETDDICYDVLADKAAKKSF